MSIPDQHFEFADRAEHLRFDLKMAMTTDADWFTAQLFRLIGKADALNRERLREGFPDAVAIWEEWQRTGRSWSPSFDKASE
jgi:hypothetical protein